MLSSFPISLLELPLLSPSFYPHLFILLSFCKDAAATYISEMAPDAHLLTAPSPMELAVSNASLTLIWFWTRY